MPRETEGHGRRACGAACGADGAACGAAGGQAPVLAFGGREGRDLRFRLTHALDARDLPAALGLSRPQAVRVRAEGRLLVGGAPVGTSGPLAPGGTSGPLAPVGTSGPLAPGTTVTLRLAHLPPASGAPDAPPVLAHDAFLLVADKPAGLLVHGDGTGAPTLTDEVRGWARAAGSDADPQAVNRLDVDTTGLVLFSLAEEFQPALDALVAGHDVDKRYLAVVEGGLDGPRTVRAPIGRDRHDARRMRVSPGGKPALTHLRPLACRDGRTLVELRIETGRRHQIRVHAAHLGHPVVGDALYGRRPGTGASGAAAGGGASDTSKPGLALHAWRLSFVHPVTGEPVSLSAPWPTRFSSLGFSPSDLPR